jgi:hypothetical protein
MIFALLYLSVGLLAAMSVAKVSGGMPKGLQALVIPMWFPLLLVLMFQIIADKER